MDKVLRASKIGFPCLRNLFYSINWQDEAIVSPKSQRIFDVGNCLEPLAVEWLKQDGWEVIYNPGSQNAELEVTVPLQGGSLAGHPDCIISKGDMHNILVDIKTMNDRSFTLWKREGSFKSKPQYVEQLHVYAIGCIRAGITINPNKLGIVGINKNNSDWHIDFFDYDCGLVADIQDKAEAVLAMTEPPTECSPTEAWCCNYCDFSHLCELKGTFKPKPAIDETLSLSFLEEDERVTHALKDLAFSRELTSQARTLEADAKQILIAEAKAKGTDTLKGGGLTCSITEKASTRFDSAAFKKAYPDMAAKFTTEGTTTYFNLKEEY